VQRDTLVEKRNLQGDQLQSRSLGRLHALPRRRTHLPVEQRRRTRSARRGSRQKNWTFAGSDEGGRRAAAVYSFIETCKLNDVDPQAWLAYVLAKLPDHPANSIDELLPWRWKAAQQPAALSAPVTIAA